MRNAPPDAAVKRFRDDLTALVGPERQRFGLAISGGPDSLALLFLAQAAGLDCAAATVDHGLRPEGANEAQFVADVCAGLGVSHQVLTLGHPEKGNVSDWARRARYTALAKWSEGQGLNLLLTAHHADDQLETMIMRLNRGAGLGGLSGVRARRGAVVRPLLGWRKSELEALVECCGVTAVQDATNRDDRFDRARLRKVLAGANWLDPVAASKSAAALGEAEEALQWATQDYVNRRTIPQNGGLSLDSHGLPREILRRVVLQCLRQICPDAEPRGEALDRLISALQSGKTVTLGGVKCKGGDRWQFALAPARQKI